MSATLHELSETMAGLVQAAGPQIVRVEARRRLPATGVVHSADGLIVTASHVVERDDEMRIGLADGSTVNASLVGRDQHTDVALLRAQASGLTPATWLDPEQLRVGHMVLALGRPGQTVQATLGIVSALGSAWRTPAGGDVERYVQTDVAMYPGFSGGPLLTASGAFAGINSSALLRGISLTIPTPTIHRVVNTLLAHGRIPRGYLGIGIQPVRLADGLQTQAGQETGLMVMSVEAGSPAAQGGLLQGDILVGLDGQPLRQVDDLQALLAGDRIGREVSVRVIRTGELRELPVTIGAAR
ncbi:MAG TPA: trypsin-like peptidase domain-containing protein [Caldilineaceae bacterium]|nr:trypsin-like peptidase domain-containing protein [Caldilineaceae bacterium]